MTVVAAVARVAERKRERREIERERDPLITSKNHPNCSASAIVAVSDDSEVVCEGSNTCSEVELLG